MSRKLMDHPLAVELAFGGVVQDVEPDQTLEQILMPHFSHCGRRPQPRLTIFALLLETSRGARSARSLLGVRTFWSPDVASPEYQNRSTISTFDNLGR
ncbi:hypothetical protein [Bradyrhizobium sp. ARR65]|uniref:hypothetical protein n=1 Tax=Bradyrhizobium sp. ARR65 TaxID=1040989 RepID=UPI0018DC4977|nr:hypothetical protein [Bradyrhizobium sp. ARR65]